MKFVRIRTYLADGSDRWTGLDHIYYGDDEAKALDRFYKRYPEHKDCFVVAETIDLSWQNDAEFIEAFMKCGCLF